MSESFFIGRNKFFIIILCLLGGAAMAQWQHAVDMSLGVRARSLSKPLPAASARGGASFKLLQAAINTHQCILFVVFS